MILHTELGFEPEGGDQATPHWVVMGWLDGANRHAGAISFMSVRAWLLRHMSSLHLAGSAWLPPFAGALPVSAVLSCAAGSLLKC